MAGLGKHKAFGPQNCRPISRLLVASTFIVLLVGGSLLYGASNPTLVLQTGTGITIGGAHPSYSGSIGNVNGLGLGAPASGVSLITSGVGAAVFYYTPYNYNISSLNGSASGIVTAYVSSNFSHPTILQLYTCLSSCTSFSSYGPHVRQLCRTHYSGHRCVRRHYMDRLYWSTSFQHKWRVGFYGFGHRNDHFYRDEQQQR